MEYFNLFLEYLPQIVVLLVAVFPAWKGIKYFKFSKEVGDVYSSYQAAVKDGVFTDAEKITFANEIIEAIESAKGLKAVKK